MTFAGFVLAAALAAPPAAHDIDAIDATKTAAMEQEKLVFCTEPVKPLSPKQRLGCNTARDLEAEHPGSCKALVEVCNGDLPPDLDWLASLTAFLGPVAQVFLYLLIAVIVIAVAIPVVAALRQLRRRTKTTAEPNVANAAEVVMPRDVPPPELTEPEAALARADELLARGEYRPALAYALSASLSALGRRGAIRLAKHRTNGEYVRSCADEAARPGLREIVRSVDAVEFGGAEPTHEKASRAAARARDIVRAAAVVSLLLTSLGCDPPKRGSDPAGDELPIAVLARNGYDVHPLGSSLGTLPVPEHGEAMPVVVIDTEKVPLESETQAHLLRWVEAGGVLVLFGRADGWPSELAAKYEPSTSGKLVVDVPDPNGGLFDPESDESDEYVGQPVHLEGKLGRRDAFAWKSGTHDVLAWAGPHTYAAKRRLGRGLVLGIANDELFTNVGVMPKHNAAALVTLVRAASHDTRRRLPLENGHVAIGDLRVARPEDGVPPPSNPFAALIAAGLGKGAWHALAAAILLFLCYGIRHARPRAAPLARRRAFVEHVEATGAFYARAPARSHALASYGTFVELRLRELAPRGSDGLTFLATRTGVELAHVKRLLQRAFEAKTDEVPRGDELEVIAELRALLAKAIATSRPRSAP